MGVSILNIAIDVDNTITETKPLLKEYCKKYNDEVVKRNLKPNPDGFAVKNLYDWTTDEKQYFIDNIIEEVFDKVKIKRDSKEIIDKLIKENHKIFILTARAIKNAYEVTEKSLKKNKINYHKLAIEKDKKTYCIDNNIDILIDDEEQNIMSVSTLIPVIVLNADHNKDCNGKNIIKADNWNEIYKIINNLGGKQ